MNFSLFWALFLEFTLEIENLKKNPHFFVATIEECAPEKFHWWHHLHNWLPEIGFSASKSKLLFMERLPKPIAQPIGVQPMIQKIVSINKSIQDYKLWIMPYDHAYDP